MKVYNIYLDGRKNIFCSYLSKEKAEGIKRAAAAHVRIEEAEVEDIDFGTVLQTESLEYILQKEKDALWSYQSAVYSLENGEYVSIDSVLKAKREYEKAKQAVIDYFSAV